MKGIFANPLLKKNFKKTFYLKCLVNCPVFSSYMYVKEPHFDKAGTKCVINSLTIIPSILNALSFPKPKKVLLALVSMVQAFMLIK